MPRKVDILKTSVSEESAQLEQRLEPGTEESGKLFPDGFSASNPAFQLDEIRVAKS